MPFKPSYKLIFLIPLMVIGSGCMTYYTRNQALMEAYEKEDFVSADEALNHKKWKKQKRNILLYYLNKGTVLHMLGDYKESNKYFQLADYYIEDYHKNYGLKALSYLSNPSVEKYSGENYEKILLHYYGALNYLMLNNLDEALVECKRMLLIMENISDYFKKDNKLHQDAFAHLLAGIIYDARHEYNDAFIAYRNAYETYRDTYEPILQRSAPTQLKKDIIRTANLSGFYSDAKSYEKEFDMLYDKTDISNSGSSLLCFWNNGMCPIKEQGSITFLITNMGNGFALFTNIELGLTFPFFVGNNQAQMNRFVGMKLLRVSYPKFVARKQIGFEGYTLLGKSKIPFELSEDIDAIAFQTLKDRMNKEIGDMLLRLAAKKLAEFKAYDTHEALGLLLNITNTVTEQADTRNWQLLPSSIYYNRVPLKQGENKITTNIGDVLGSTIIQDTLTITTGDRSKLYFHSINTIQ